MTVERMAFKVFVSDCVIKMAVDLILISTRRRLV